jgi:phospholipid/cholesterol/gamma-HCH transport system permease protein
MAQGKVLTGFVAPPGLAESTGRIVIDGGRVLRHPGLKYWSVLLRHTTDVVRTAGPIAWLMCFFLGGFTTLTVASVVGRFGIDPGLAGLIVSSMGLRELTLIVGTAAVGSSVGAGFVTTLGAMRVSEEIDAIEVMSIDSYPYLVSTRVWASLIAALPVFVGAIAFTFAGGYMSALFQVSGMNQGSYLQFFWIGFAPIDVVFALAKGVVATGTLAIVCASTGYRASGGPVGVGMAVGEALNVSLVLVMYLNLIMSYLFWGLNDTVKI